MDPFAAGFGFGVGVCGAVVGGPTLCGVGHEGEVVHYICSAEGDTFVCLLWVVLENR